MSSARPKRWVKPLRRAVQLQGRNELDKAEAIYEDYLRECPNDIAVLYNMGFLWQARGDVGKAGDFYGNCVCIASDDGETKGNAMNNLGHMLDRLGYQDKAAICFSIAKDFNPTKPEIINNYANALAMDLRFEDAEKELARCTLLAPNDPKAKFNRAVIALTTGDMARGWKEYEWRWSWKEFSTKPYETNRPRWKGEDVKGKTVLITAEQGFGDSIMFIRYAKMVKALGATVHWYGHTLLKDIFDGVKGIDHQVTEGEEEAFDYHTPLLSLPKIFKTDLSNIPSDCPYITAQPSWKPYPLTVGHPSIGICWAGSPKHAKDKLRSIEPEMFQPLIDEFKKFDWHSFQIGPRAGECSRLRGVMDHSKTVTGFTDTAQALEQMDLVISVDTSLVHLACALNRPVWMLTPYAPDWRWMLEREDSPWYPSLRLFRQRARGDWASVFERVINQLMTWTPLTKS